MAIHLHFFALSRSLTLIHTQHYALFKEKSGVLRKVNDVDVLSTEDCNEIEQHTTGKGLLLYPVFNQICI